jgi:hypothetical protein
VPFGVGSCATFPHSPAVRGPLRACAGLSVFACGSGASQHSTVTVRAGRSPFRRVTLREGGGTPGKAGRQPPRCLFSYFWCSSISSGVVPRLLSWGAGWCALARWLLFFCLFRSGRLRDGEVRELGAPFGSTGVKSLFWRGCGSRWGVLV